MTVHEIVCSKKIPREFCAQNQVMQNIIYNEKNPLHNAMLKQMLMMLLEADFVVFSFYFKSDVHCMHFDYNV